MGLSRAARVMLIIAGVIIVFVGRATVGLESEYGGQSRTEAHRLGHLSNGQVEVRQIVWNHLDGNTNGDYNVVAHGDDRYSVVLVAGEAIQFTGTGAEVDEWLDEQGPRLFIGTQPEVEIYMSGTRSERRNYLVPALIIAVGIGLVLVALIPNRRPETQNERTPATPAD